MKLLLIASFLIITACASNNNNKQAVIYTYNGQDETVKQVLNKCNYESAVLALSIYEAKRHMTQEDVIRLEKWLRDKCVVYYGVVI